MAADDADYVTLQSRVDRRLDTRRRVLPGRGHHHLDEVRGQERRGRAREAQALVPSLTRLFGRQRSGRLHAPEHRALACDRLVAIAERVVSGWTLWEPGQKRGLRRRQHRRLGREVGAARLAGADGLVAVGREIEIEREHFALVEAMFQPQREDGLADLFPHTTRPFRRPAIEQELRDLLRDRRATLDDTALDEVLAQSPGDGDRIDARMRPEATVLGRERRRDEDRRQVPRVEVHVARAITRQRLVERHAATIDDDGRRHVVQLEERRIDRPKAQPEREGDERDQADRADRTPTAHDRAAYFK